MASHNSKSVFFMLGAASIAIISASVLSGCQSKGHKSEARTINFGNGAEPKSLDPHQALGTWEHQIISDMMMGLVTDDKDGKPIPGIATSWENSKNGLVWTFHLRDAKWSDGVPVTANDFVFAWQRLFTMKPPAEYASLLFLVKNAEDIYNGKKEPAELGIKAIDDKTLEVMLNHPAPYFPSLMSHYISYPLPKHIVEKFGNNWVKPEHIVVDGPFKLEKWSPNDFIHVVKNQQFFDAKNVCLNDLYYYPTQDPIAAERSVKSGKLDIQSGFSSSRTAEINKSLPNYARISDSLAVSYYIFNSKKPPFDNPKVRQALSMTIDREFITNKILKGGQKPAYSIVPPGIQNYESGKAAPDWQKMPRAQRLEAARKLLQEAGYGPNKPLSFTITYRNSGDNPKIIPVVQQNWREIGPWVNVDVAGSDVQIAYEKMRQGDFDVGDAGWAADFNDARNFLYNYETSAGDMNYGKFSNPEFDALVKQSDNEKDAKKREELMIKAEKILMEQNAAAPSTFGKNRSLVNPRITGWVENANDYHRARYLCTKEAEAEK